MSLILLPPLHDSCMPLRLLQLPAHLPPLFSWVPAPLSPSTRRKQGLSNKCNQGRYTRALNLQKYLFHSRKEVAFKDLLNITVFIKFEEKLRRFK